MKNGNGGEEKLKSKKYAKELRKLQGSSASSRNG
jgi:hypothetical protein